MASERDNTNQNLSLGVSRQDGAYERAEGQALALLEQGFHLGGVIRVSRDELHERERLR